MNWIQLTNKEQIAEVDKESYQQKIVIFKHSTRCSISDAALGRLERNAKESDTGAIRWYFLDLLQYRDLSNFIAEHYGLQHESPQALLIQNGACGFSQTHSQIRLSDLLNV